MRKIKEFYLLSFYLLSFLFAEFLFIEIFTLCRARLRQIWDYFRVKQSQIEFCKRDVQKEGSGKRDLILIARISNPPDLINDK